MALDTTIALITLAEAKEYLKISGSGEDAILNSLINMTSAWAQSFIGRRLISQSYVEYYNGDGSDSLILLDAPVTAVASIYIDSNRVFGSDTLVDSSDYFIEEQSGIIRAFNLLGSWTCGRANIKVSSTRGYTAGTDVPHEIRMAACRILDHHYRTGYTHRKLDVASETTGDQTLTYRDGDIPADAKSILLPYRRNLESPHFAYAD